MRWGSWMRMGLGAVLLCASGAWAGQKRFSFMSETSTLAPGAQEVELSVEPHVGRSSAYAKFKNKLEWEMGVVPHLQTSIYFNTESVIEGAVKQADLSWSLANEWKWNLMDPVADPFGLGLYGEVTLGFHEVELEGKLLLDKRMGPWYASVNLIGEHEWELGDGPPVREEKLAAGAGLVWFANDSISFGLEARVHGIHSTDEGYEGSALFLGPVFSWAGRNAWVTISAMPQLVGFQGAGSPTVGSALELAHHERFIGRIIVGFTP